MYVSEIIDKILDYDLEDEVIMDYLPPPLTIKFRDERCPQKVMSVLCELPNGPHDAARENYLRLLAQHDEYHREDARRQQLVKEAIQFAIKSMRPEEENRVARDTEVRTRLCPACLEMIPSCLARCTRCFSVFKSYGKFQRTAPQRDSPLEGPHHKIASAMRAATAATSANANAHEDEEEKVMTMPAPEMEVNEADVTDEAEPDEEQQEEHDEDEDQDEIAERLPVILQENLHLRSGSYSGKSINASSLLPQCSSCVVHRRVIYIHGLHCGALYAQVVDWEHQVG